jgi:uncharacterized protein (TIGR02246 family)
MDDLRELVHRERIRDLVARYNQLGDRGRSEDVAALFAEDGVLEYVEDGHSEEVTGRAAVVAFLERVKERWLADATPGRVLHVVGSHVIDVEDDDHARGDAYVVVVRADGLAEWGRYRDRYVRKDGRWVIAHRRATTDGRLVGGSLAAAGPDRERA